MEVAKRSVRPRPIRLERRRGVHRLPGGSGHPRNTRRIRPPGMESRGTLSRYWRWVTPLAQQIGPKKHRKTIDFFLTKPKNKPNVQATNPGIFSPLKLTPLGDSV